jgi:hypothetical protein
VLPRVRVERHGTDGAKHALLIKTTNPTLGIIRLQLQSSTYSGEPLWDNKGKSNPILENLLVDTLSQTTINAKLTTEFVHSLQATDICQLEPAEDSFLELSSSSNEEPDEIRLWEASTILSKSTVSTESSPSSLRLVAQKSDVAWFELVHLETARDDDMHPAIPLALQIEVGDGSWETSLIQPEPVNEGGGKDMVTFDLVLAWK